MRVFAYHFRRSGRRTGGCVVAVALSIAMAGCGSRDTAESAEEDAKKNEAQDARPVVLVNRALETTFDTRTSLTSTKDALTEGTVVVRSAVVDGTPECHMSISKGDDTSMDFLVNDSGAYTRVSEEMVREAALRQGQVVPEQITALAGQWVKRGADEAEVMREELCRPEAQRAQLEEQLLTPKNLRHGKKEAASLNGRPTTKLTFTGGPSRLEVQVAAEGRPYLLKIVEYGGVLWEFGGFDKPYRVSTPETSIDESDVAAEILDAV